MKKRLVSILTPCYNTGALLHRLLDSVLRQDYPLVEMFCIDDGSTDNLKEVVESYIPKFAEKGYKLTYVYQENSGQSVAVNNGLKLVNGEYLMWPDSDDYYTNSDIISQMVARMEEGVYDIGRCQIQYVDEKDLHFVKAGSKPVSCSTDQFDNIVFGTGGIDYPPVGFILRMSSLDEAIPGREIYTEKNAGQNWQLMMPLSFHKKMFFLDVVGASVLVRGDSHSRGQFVGYEKSIEKQDVYRHTILKTLERMPMMSKEEKEMYSKNIELLYLHIKMLVSMAHGKSKEALYYMKYGCSLSGKKYPIFTTLICKYCNCKPIFMVLRGVRKLFKITI